MTILIDPEGKEVEALPKIVDFTGLRVLDAGCGDGRLVWRIAPEAGSVLGVDMETEDIETARRETELDEPPHRFDLVFFTWSL